MLALFSKARAITLMAVSALMLAVMAVPAMAQDASALTDPLKQGATQALTAGFGVAAVLLVGFLIYRAVRRFTSA